MKPGAAKVNEPLSWTSVNAGGPLYVGGLLYSSLRGGVPMFRNKPGFQIDEYDARPCDIAGPDTESTTLRSTATQLLNELNKIRNELLDERAEIRSDLKRLLDFFATQKKFTPIENSPRSLGCGETAEAQAILAAQSRFEARNASRAELKVTL
jgi:hypothetical protein